VVITGTGQREVSGALGFVGPVSWAGAVALFFRVAMVCAVRAIGSVLLDVLRQNGRLLLRIEALEGKREPEVIRASTSEAAFVRIGASAPDFSLRDLDGATVTLDALLARGLPLILVFSDPHCAPCNALMPQVALWQHQYADKVTVTVVSRGTADEHHALGQAIGSPKVLLQSDREIAIAYRAHATPTAVGVYTDGTIASAAAPGAAAIADLLTTMAGGSPHANAQHANGVGTGVQ
jgi:peroxiredoxin